MLAAALLPLVLAPPPGDAAADAAADLRAEVRAGLEARVAAITRFRYETTATLHSWPLDASLFFERAGLRPGGPRFLETVHRRAEHDDSWKLELTRRLFQTPDGGGEAALIADDVLVNAFDAATGKYRAVLTSLHDPALATAAVVDGEPDDIVYDDRLAYFTPGFRHWQGVNAVDLLLDRLDAVTLRSGEGPDRLVVASLEDRDRRTPTRHRRLTVWLDPARGFLPVRHEILLTTIPNGEPVWLERLAITASAETDGVWMPAKFQLIQSILRKDLPPAWYDVTVDSLSVGRTTAEDVAFRFPAGVRVVDRLRGHRYTAGEDGTPAGDPVPLRR